MRLPDVRNARAADAPEAWQFERSPCPEERQDRMKERGNRKLNLSACGKAFIGRNDLPQYSHLGVDDQPFVAFRIIPAARNQFSKKGVGSAEHRIDPAEIEEYLQVAELLVGKVFRHSDNVGFGIPESALRQQFIIARENFDHVIPVGEEKIFEEKMFVFIRHVRRIDKRHFKERSLARFSVYSTNCCSRDGTTLTVWRIAGSPQAP